MKNYIQRGDIVTVPAPADTDSGDLVVIGALVGVANGDAATGEDLDLSTVGVFDLPKVAVDVVTVGADIYFDAGTSLVTINDAAGANPRIGVAVADAGNPSASVAVRLD